MTPPASCFSGVNCLLGQSKEAPRQAQHVPNEAVFDPVANQVEEADVARSRPQLTQEACSLLAARIESMKVGVGSVSASTATAIAHS